MAPARPAYYYHPGYLPPATLSGLSGLSALLLPLTVPIPPPKCHERHAKNQALPTAGRAGRADRQRRRPGPGLSAASGAPAPAAPPMTRRIPPTPIWRRWTAAPPPPPPPARLTQPPPPADGYSGCRLLEPGTATAISGCRAPALARHTPARCGRRATGVSWTASICGTPATGAAHRLLRRHQLRLRLYRHRFRGRLLGSRPLLLQPCRDQCERHHITNVYAQCGGQQHRQPPHQLQRRSERHPAHGRPARGRRAQRSPHSAHRRAAQLRALGGRRPWAVLPAQPGPPAAGLGTMARRRARDRVPAARRMPAGQPHGRAECWRAECWRAECGRAESRRTEPRRAASRPAQSGRPERRRLQPGPPPLRSAQAATASQASTTTIAPRRDRRLAQSPAAVPGAGGRPASPGRAWASPRMQRPEHGPDNLAQPVRHDRPQPARVEAPRRRPRAWKRPVRSRRPARRIHPGRRNNGTARNAAAANGAAGSKPRPASRPGAGPWPRATLQ